MSIELAVQLWKETRNFIHDSHDKKEAAEAAVAVLMENFDAEEIRNAFKWDKKIITAVAEYAGLDEIDADPDEFWDDDY